MNISQRFKLLFFMFAFGVLFLFVIQSASVQAQTQSFSDVPSTHPFAASIRVAREQRFVAGYPNGTFAPDSSVSRAEFITMVIAATEENPQGSNCFSDVRDEWFARFVCTAKTQGLVSGYPDGSFKPANNINTAEASAIISKANNLNRPAVTGPWFKAPIMSLEQEFAIPTTIDYVSHKVSRGETAEMIWRIKNDISDKPTKTYESLTEPVPALASCAELQEKVEAFQYRQSKEQLGLITGVATGAVVPGPLPPQSPTMAPSMAAESANLQDSAATSYSTTNVQVEGVDEADIVKNDAQYIYIVSGRTVRVIRAFPPQNLAQESRLTFTDENFVPSDLYIDGNKIVVIGQTSNNLPVPMPEIMPINYGSPRTKVYIINAADKQNLIEERSVEFDGNQISSRKIGNRLFLVLNNYPDFYVMESGSSSARDLLPKFLDSRNGEERPIASCADIHFIPDYDQMNFLILVSIDLSDPASTVQKETVMGAGETIYASLESLYIAATKYEYPEVGIYDIWAPPQSSEKTKLMRFNIADGNLSFVTQGEVEGRILNQFSMDESGETFRIATTSGEVWNSRNPSSSNVFVLDKNNLANITGSLNNIAPGKTIYSVRFMGNRAYMVTFKKIDPFFVIDLENPSNPRILGELKIPGFSDYLHPFDENHIIGFGKDAVDPQEVEQAGLGRDFNFAWYQGMKIALFDVTDVANPRMMFNEVIGDRGTDSEVLHNHKALMYDRERNIFAFPVTVMEIADRTAGSYTGPQMGTPVFQGAYVYSLDLQNGFQFKGRVTHLESPNQLQNASYFWMSDPGFVKRIVSMGDYLYTISLNKVKGLNISDLQEVGSTTLEVDEEETRPIPLPM